MSLNGWLKGVRLWRRPRCAALSSRGLWSPCQRDGELSRSRWRMCSPHDMPPRSWHAASNCYRNRRSSCSRWEQSWAKSLISSRHRSWQGRVRIKQSRLCTRHNSDTLFGPKPRMTDALSFTINSAKRFSIVCQRMSVENCISMLRSISKSKLLIAFTIWLITLTRPDTASEHCPMLSRPQRMAGAVMHWRSPKSNIESRSAAYRTRTKPPGIASPKGSATCKCCVGNTARPPRCSRRQACCRKTK